MGQMELCRTLSFGLCWPTGDIEGIFVPPVCMLVWARSFSTLRQTPKRPRTFQGPRISTFVCRSHRRHIKRVFTSISPYINSLILFNVYLINSSDPSTIPPVCHSSEVVSCTQKPHQRRSLPTPNPMVQIFQVPRGHQATDRADKVRIHHAFKSRHPVFCPIQPPD